MEWISVLYRSVFITIAVVSPELQQGPDTNDWLNCLMLRGQLCYQNII